MANADVHAVLTMCGTVNNAHRVLMINNESFQTLEDIALMDGDNDVERMARRASQHTAADGHVLLGTVQIEQLQALVW